MRKHAAMSRLTALPAQRHATDTRNNSTRGRVRYCLVRASGAAFAASPQHMFQHHLNRPDRERRASATHSKTVHGSTELHHSPRTVCGLQISSQGPLGRKSIGAERYLHLAQPIGTSPHTLPRHGGRRDRRAWASCRCARCRRRRPVGCASPLCCLQPRFLPACRRGLPDACRSVYRRAARPWCRRYRSSTRLPGRSGCCAVSQLRHS